MNTTLLQTEWEACLLPPARDAALEAQARKAYGQLPPAMPYLLHSPWVARAYIRLNPDQGLLMELEPRLRDVVSMVVSQENSCRYCFAICNLLLRVQGLSDARIAELQAQLAQGTADARTTAAVAYARRMARSQPLSGAQERQQLLDAGFTPGEVRELAYLVAFLSWVNRLSTILAVPPHALEQMPDRWLFGLLRPLIARSMSAHRRRGTPSPGPAPAAAVYPDLQRAFAGSPVAAALADVCNDMWASPTLTRRCKALLLAVVATGLDCRRSVQQAQALLREEGVPDGVMEHALRHLHAPELTPEENLLLPFARETIWYQPAPVQRRARVLCDHLTHAQVVDAVSVVSLANALCRLVPAVLEAPP